MEYYPAAGLSDAMGSMNVMDAQIKNVAPGMKVMGPAFTVSCYPCSIITCHKALGEAPAGSVLVVSGSADPNGALWGELTSMEAMQRGIAGIVVDGAVRDVEKIRELGFPVFTRYITPRVGAPRKVGQTQVDVVCGGVTVHMGDLIVGDDDGVVVIPKDEAEHYLQAACAVEEKEAKLAVQVREGAHLADVLGMSELINAAK